MNARSCGLLKNVKSLDSDLQDSSGGSPVMAAPEEGFEPPA